MVRRADTVDRQAADHTVATPLLIQVQAVGMVADRPVVTDAALRTVHVVHVDITVPADHGAVVPPAVPGKSIIDYDLMQRRASGASRIWRLVTTRPICSLCF